MGKLGFTFYPKDWWTSDTYFDLEPLERYIYLECLFFMYQNDGYLTISMEQLGIRIRTQIEPKTWEKITNRFNLTNLGFTHNSVKKRRTKADTSRENGKLGGRPLKPNNPNLNPPLEREIETKNKREIESKINNKKVFNFRKELLAFGFEENLVDDWLKVRKTKKATNTETAFRNFIIEIHKSNIDYNIILDKCVTNSWAGFKNDWLKEEKNKISSPMEIILGKTQ